MDYLDRFLLEDDLDILEIIDYGFPRKIYVRKKHFDEMDDLTFFRNNSLCPLDQILCTLRFYSGASHLCSVADFMGCDVSTASRVIARVSDAIASLRPQIVKMPDLDEIIREQNKFYDIAKFPRVLAVVDGTHVKINSPGGNNPQVYRNRKGYFSYNIQVACNVELKIVDVVARCPGSSHDATIFANSNLRLRFEAGEFPGAILLGDSGYALRPSQKPSNCR